MEDLNIGNGDRTMANESVKEIKVRVVEIIKDKIIVILNGLRMAFKNKNSKYKKGDIVTLQCSKDKITLK